MKEKSGENSNSVPLLNEKVKEALPKYVIMIPLRRSKLYQKELKYCIYELLRMLLVLPSLYTYILL